MFERYKEDIQCFMEHDPAARSPIEIVLLYPGFKALRSHRKALWWMNTPDCLPDTHAGQPLPLFRRVPQTFCTLFADIHYAVRSHF